MYLPRLHLLVAFLDPIWFKIADFGTSKYGFADPARNIRVYRPQTTKGYSTRDPGQARISPIIQTCGHWVVVVYELLTLEMPFYQTDGNESRIDGITGLRTGLSH